ncbi:TraR/DksA C4-type zinc finger protein [Bacillus xiapuensis]|uniref:TraR/DksA C4-type zinc finger protein n=1 Tax=Bacillus xiapuensis TaxID=2014075 RepID=UPI000C2466AE|nr:TraR/DksA C4-type zinc finger protein [Bacillus xiapuensis]
MLTNQQVQQLKEELLSQKEQLISSTDIESMQDASGELSAYDNHPADLGTELFERSKDIALQDHEERELAKVQQALQAIEKGTYGKCQICEKEIAYDRLKAMPAAIYCVEHSPEQIISRDRPIEEEILQPAKGERFLHEDDEIDDNKDSFQTAAQYGTSESPSDFTGDHPDYNELYEDQKEATETYESFTATDITGKEPGFIRSNEEQEYRDQLDEKQTESPLGDIPYKKKDSYLNK